MFENPLAWRHGQTVVSSHLGTDSFLAREDHAGLKEVHSGPGALVVGVQYRRRIWLMNSPPPSESSPLSG